MLDVVVEGIAIPDAFKRQPALLDLLPSCSFYRMHNSL
jgi:hypothetical protein